jgi:hypothetical protein
MAEDGEAEALGLAREEHTPMPRPGAALDLLDCGLHVPVGERHDREESTAVGRGPVDQEVVVGAHAGEFRLVVIEATEDLIAESADVGIEDHRPDAELVHVFQPGMRVV